MTEEYNPLLSNRVQNIKPSGIRKFFDIVSMMDDAISLGVGEPDFDTPWHIKDEAIYALSNGHTHYTGNNGLALLRQEISNYLDRKFNVKYSPDNVIVTVGGSEAIDLAMRAMLNNGDEVIIPEPSYVAYTPCVTLSGGVPVIIKLLEENQFRLTGEQLLSVITEKTKLLVLPFPNNPTGAVLRKEDLEAIAEICDKHNIYILSDEIYAELTYGDKHCSIASLPGMAERTVYISGFSKAYAMTGWRLGYVCGPKFIISAMLKIHQYAIMCAPTLSQYSAVEALKNGDSSVALMREEYNRRRLYLLSQLKEMDIYCFEPFGAFYVFPNISKWGLSSEEFAEQLLEREKLAVVPGTAFGESGEGFIRLSYAYSLDELKKAISRLKSFIGYLDSL